MAKALLIIIGILALIVILFNVHWLLGLGVIAGGLGYLVYANQSVWKAMRANAAYAQGDQDKALALMEKAYRSKRAKPLHNVNYAFLLMKAGNAEKAEQVLEEILRSESSTDIRMRAKCNLATAYWLRNRQAEAVALLEEVHREYKTVTVVGNLGYFMLLSGPPESALAFNEEAYAYDDDDLTIMDNLAQNYYLLRRLDDAATMYGKVMDKSPKFAESYYYYAKTLEGLGRKEEAAEQVSLALGKPLALVTSITMDEIQRLESALSVREFE